MVVNQTSSQQAPVIIRGVLQGSVLGPVLFNIFVNDMPERVNSMINIFADYIKIFRRIDTLKD